MHVKLLSIEFRLAGCQSLKEKRQRLGGLREKFGRASNVAVCEEGCQDSLQRARWSFVAIANSGRVVEQTLMELERSIQMHIDAEVINIDTVNL